MVNPKSVVGKILGYNILLRDRHSNNMVVYYHGTKVKNVPSIKQHGLLPRQELEKMNIRKKGKYQPFDVSLTRNRAEASDYAGPKGAIVVVDIPQEKHKELDIVDWRPHGYFGQSAKYVPPEYIKEVQMKRK